MTKKKTISRAMTYSGFVLTFETERTQWLFERLHSGHDLTESFSSFDSEFERRELVLLVLSKDPIAISAMALMEQMHGTGGSGKLKMRMSNLIPFDPPIVDHDLDSTDLKAIVCTPETLERTSNSTWNSLVEELRRLRPQMSWQINRLIALRSEEHRILGESERVERLNEQRDAVGLCLDIAQLDRPNILKNLKSENIGDAKSILDLLDAQPIHERTLLEHDARIFELLLGRAPKKYAMFSDRGERYVRIYVSDQTPIESALGVDLVIYNVCYESFLLLQYKKMNKEKSKWSYHIHPSSQIHHQLLQMHTFSYAVARTPQVSATLWSYRLNDTPFYFKFCEQFRPDARDDSLIPGITVTDVHFREFLTLPEAKGPNGGLLIGYENCPRYLNNTEFIQLARAGWIGAEPRSLPLVEQILKASVTEGRSAVLAVIDTPQTKSASGRTRKVR